MNIQIGDKLESKRTDIWDKVTKGKVYEVKDVFEGYGGMTQFFKIENDDGKVTMPIGASFRKVESE
jgi:hypothetical protein